MTGLRLWLTTEPGVQAAGVVLSLALTAVGLWLARRLPRGARE
jgi:hypothetical protein